MAMPLHNIVYQSTSHAWGELGVADQRDLHPKWHRPRLLCVRHLWSRETACRDALSPKAVEGLVFGLEALASVHATHPSFASPCSVSVRACCVPRGRLRGSGPLE